MLLTDARRPARFSPTGELVTLPEQDRSRWDRSRLAEGLAIVRERATAAAWGGDRPGRYQLLAAINAVHSLAPSARDTDWVQVLALYDALSTVDPSPIVRLNRAVALAETAGPEVALVEVDTVADRLGGYHALHLTRAELLGRVGREREARAAYDRAIALTANLAEREHLARRRDQLGH
jgi:RNA polymerase sigma-70 factor (ECF subfamily)